MADRCFLIEDLLPKMVSLNMPPFLKEREQLERIEIVETCRIASVRIHEERAIECIKNFQILSVFTSFLFSLGCAGYFRL